jgi:ParB/RepB/Spo0J family partition protein
MMPETLECLPVSQLHPHPCNPRIEPRRDVVDQIAAQIGEKFDLSHALIVRPNASGWEIISGHHRWLAAQQVGLITVPCWVRDYDDATAYMQLVLCNTQSELHPLEEGKHAAESGMDLKAYAAAVGKNEKTLHTKVRAWRVRSNLHVEIDNADWRNLAEIHAAPEWLWAALVERMLALGWTVVTTREKVASCKGWRGHPSPPLARTDSLSAAIPRCARAGWRGCTGPRTLQPLAGKGVLVFRRPET